MLGWELPPFHSGGLGIACSGLTKSLSKLGMDIDFVLPKIYGGSYPWMRLHDASSKILDNGFSHKCVEIARKNQCSLVNGYQGVNLESNSKKMCNSCIKVLDNSRYAHINLYTRGVKELAEGLDYDLIHAHDWMTFPAGFAAQAVSKLKGKEVPLLIQAHATEIDRHDGSFIYHTEKDSFQRSDHIVAVSNITKSTIVNYYGIDQNKISVVHNGIDPREITERISNPIKKKYKVVMFLGRITYQKGPDYFVKVAKKVTESYPNVKFMMLGSGDMQARMIEEGAKQGLTGKLLFNSWISDEDKDLAYQLADVFVMPSVTEPFGIVPLEAIQNGTPVVVSKSSGIAEVVDNSVKVDFWDIEKQAEEIVKLLKDKKYAASLVKGAKAEVKGLTWDKSAKEMAQVYKKVVAGGKVHA
ncbi:MAG: Glycosyl transferase, group 1 family [candidate division CPR2 bacterium GW2011_GWC1_41_48]|uniref:Glycosyl transferase, group 1 family n=1 Tax=candidate division CPR2 bacterium GW2011_GWC1_41_48 TaxID=1618344 RepID=A0A0G0W956_UNCC2|nr:MAG: Glycosyl transferase, group 1 family [candidate division CPR2 bacterium GW2011_GWC2_39_35]KKR27937.1 MAG: Glycosyl transferase, group 1 family [candidate division CPR2 bacterium GW2011_GWD1_39_7]KKR29019.1 MAG: Glycosyl transferase, group 1 family [candidate division CPR2 bacterium GW2011_GWD2_39_7]KKS09515.1 MAG: Glycosyl transferase, group 1 family [candidate division CPR2 bacterium GW2011_GWC1_41_48]